MTYNISFSDTFLGDKITGIDFANCCVLCRETQYLKGKYHEIFDHFFLLKRLYLDLI